MTEIVCVECGSRNIVKKGTDLFRYGKVRKYKCMNCARNFSVAIEDSDTEELENE